MKIININERKINACFVFVEGNCEISVSTIFNSDKPEVAVFDKYAGELLKDKLYSVSSAIRWACDFGPRD